MTPNRIYHEAAFGVLSRDRFVEMNGLELKGQYIGQTVHVVKETIANSLGGALFVDEAYQLDPSNSNAGRQVLEMLVKEMDARQGSLTVVFAGPSKEMDLFLSSTPGLSSRVRRTVRKLFGPSPSSAPPCGGGP